MSSPAESDAKRPSTTTPASERKTPATSSSAPIPSSQTQPQQQVANANGGLATASGGGQQLLGSGGGGTKSDGLTNGSSNLGGVGVDRGSNGDTGDAFGESLAGGPPDRLGSDSQGLAAALAAGGDSGNGQGGEKRGSKDRSNAIDRQLEDDQRKFKKECKILLLGE
jgi:hypothetical protein